MHYAVLYCTVLYCTVLYCTVLYTPFYYSLRVRVHMEVVLPPGAFAVTGSPSVVHPNLLQRILIPMYSA